MGDRPLANLPRAGPGKLYLKLDRFPVDLQEAIIRDCGFAASIIYLALYSRAIRENSVVVKASASSFKGIASDTTSREMLKCLEDAGYVQLTKAPGRATLAEILPVWGKSPEPVDWETAWDKADKAALDVALSGVSPEDGHSMFTFRTIITDGKLEFVK